jgi:hypothetical protein
MTIVWDSVLQAFFTPFFLQAFFTQYRYFVVQIYVCIETYRKSKK